jgi:hypothetical protein
MLIWVLVVWVAFVLVAAWWVRRHDREIDSYYEREYRDPPITDITDRIHGGGS